MNVSGSSSTNTYSDLGLALRDAAAEKDRTQLGQADFLRLMTTQLQFQDPFKPMENGEFLGQMAQFSTVSGIQGMQSSIDALAGALTSNQTLQAAAMVGRNVVVPGDVGYLGESGALQGAVEVPESGPVSVEITDASGAVVRRLDLGTLAAGTASFSWDGLDGDGKRLPAGLYGVAAQRGYGASAEALSTQAAGLVSSVSLDSDGINLHLLGMGSVSLSEVRQIL